MGYVLHELRPDVQRDKMHKLAMPRLENNREYYLSSKKPELHLSICWRLWPIKRNAVTGHQSARRTTPLE